MRPIQNPIASLPLTGILPTPPPPSTAARPPVSTDSLEVSSSPSTRINNISGDRGLDEIRQRLLTFRQRVLRGEPIPDAEMTGYQKTTFNNKATLYLDRDYFTEGVFPAITHADTSIHIAMRTFDGTRVGKYTADLLIKKKLQNPGIEIRVLTDNVGSNNFLPWSAAGKNIRRMRAAGIEVELVNFFTEGLEHRKSVIIDSKLAFVGGTCFSDRYFGNKLYWKAFDKTQKEQGLEAAQGGAFLPKARRLPNFKIEPSMMIPANADFGVSFEGAAVLDLQAGFLQSWLKQGQPLNPELNDARFLEKYFSPPPPTGTTPVKANHGIPWGPSEMKQTILSIIEGASTTLEMEIAYLHVPRFTEALVSAAARGVRVRLISNSQAGIDAEGKWHINRQFYDRLLAGGVEIYELPTFTHRKLMVADNRIVFISSGNPEWHSWHRAWDEMLLIDSPKLAEDIEKRVFAHGFSPPYGQKVTRESLTNETLLTRLKTATIVSFYNLVIRFYLWATRVSNLRTESRNYVNPSPAVTS